MAKYRYFMRPLDVPDALVKFDDRPALPAGQRVVGVIDSRPHRLPTHTTLWVLVEELVD